MAGWSCCQKQCIIKSLRKIFLFCTIFKNAGAIPGKGKDNWKAYIITKHVNGEWSWALVVAEKNMKSEPDAKLKDLLFMGLKNKGILKHPARLGKEVPISKLGDTWSYQCWLSHTYSHFLTLPLGCRMTDGTEPWSVKCKSRWDARWQIKEWS